MLSNSSLKRGLSLYFLVMKTIVVVGTGYVGLVTGASLVSVGYHVTCVDVDEQKIAQLKNGHVSFFEPGLQDLVERGIESKRLRFETDLSLALKNATYCFLALPTPSSFDNSCDLHFVFTAAKSVAEKMQGPLVIINKSTVPVGTSKKITKIICGEMQKRGCDFNFSVVSNPEFLREGSAVYDFKQPKRILIGTDNSWARELMIKLYAPFSDKLFITDCSSSELAKYASNAMLAMRLTMINTFSNLCEKLGGDIEAIRKILGKDPRIGLDYLSPGPGFGGSCLPKDVRALSAICKEIGESSAVFDEILQINEAQQQSYVEKIVDFFEKPEDQTLAIWGLSFKPDTDDLRESPSVNISQKLSEAGFKLRIFDPASINKAQHLANKRTLLCETETEAAIGADAIILLTDWKRFSYVDFSSIGPLMRSKVFFDGRNQLIEHNLQSLGFEYFPIGKPLLHQIVLT